MTAAASRSPAVFLEAVRAGDGPALSDLDRASSTHPWTPRHFEDAIRGAAGERVVVLRGPDGARLGFCAWQEVADEAHVHNVAIEPEHRRRGLARRLLLVCLELAASRSARRAFLEVRAGNGAARKLYLGLGFHETGLRAGYYAEPREDAVLMEAEIRPGGSGTES
jgi:ribosomal-protein-alanine N-acetyltransferase